MCHLQSINHGEFINEGRNSKLCKHIRLIVKQIQIRVTPFSAFFQISGHTIVGQASHLSDIRTKILSAASSWESTNTRVFSVFLLTMMATIVLDLIFLLRGTLFVTSTEYICHNTYSTNYIRVDGTSNVTVFPSRAFACHLHVRVNIR